MSVLDHKSRWEAMQATEAGQQAHEINEVLYDHSGKIGDAATKRLRDAQHFLEKLAWRELDMQLLDAVPKWAVDHLKESGR